MKCFICEKEFKSNNGLGYHLKCVHKMSFKEHYDKYIKTENEGICKVCGKPTSFRQSFYSEYCSPQCVNIGTKEKRYNTMTERYGAKTTLESNILSKKVETTNLTKYGKEKINLFGSDEFKNLMVEKYGVDNYFKTFTKEEHRQYSKMGHTESAKQKREETCFNRFGEIHPMKCKSIVDKIHYKYTFNNHTFDSSWELAYYIWLTDNNIRFEYQPDICFDYDYNGEKHSYYPDFLVENKFQEIKGLQFFENKDVTNKMINPFDHSQDDLYEAKHQCMIANNVEIITNCDNYLKYVEEKYTKDFLQLFKNNLSFPYPENDIIKKYHHSIYDAHIKNKPSPIEAWNDKNLIYKTALNRLKYKGRCKPPDIIQGFNVTKIAPKVSVFKRSLAKYLINTYLNEFNEIFDPFSGFSGRMLGAFDCNKKYIGQDINNTHILESICIKNELNINAELICKDIFESSGTYQCLFTCSPYNLKEIWNENETDLSCDEWIDICLKRFNCKSYLFVVDETIKYKNNIVETLKNKSHFNTNNEYVILIKK